MNDQFAQTVRQVSQRQDVRQAVREVYDALGREIDKRRPICVSSGRCCHFEEFGHRLFVTTMELAVFLDALRRGGVSPPSLQGSANPLTILGQQAAHEPWDGTGCPFQVDKLCTVHAFRPFGCRIFFCDETSTQWQQEQYELFHADLKRHHERLSVPYFYVEWREALRALGLP